MRLTQNAANLCIEKMAQVAIIAFMAIACGLAITLIGALAYFIAVNAITYAIN